MRPAIALLPILFFAIPQVNAQQDCDKLLAGGLFDTAMNSADSSDQKRTKDWFCSKNFKTADEAKKLGLGADVPIDGVPIPFTFDDNTSSFQSEQAQYCSSAIMDQSQADKTSSFISTASKIIVDGFNSCLDKDGVHYQVTDMTASGGDIVVGISAQFRAKQPVVVHITKVIASGALTCNSTGLIGTEIDPNTKHMICHKTGRHAGALIIDADYGAGLVQSFPAPLPPYRIGTGSFAFTFCVVAGCAPPATIVPWGPPPGPTPFGDCVLHDMTPYMPAGAILIMNKQAILTPGTVRKGSFGDLRPTNIEALDSHTMQFCGSRVDGNVFDDMDITASFKYAAR